MDARACIDGVVMPLSEAALPLLDEGVQRGDGAYDTVGVWDGRPFRLDDHLERLAASLAAIRLPPVDEAALRAEIAKLLDGVRGDAVLRFHLTASGTRVVTLAPPPVRREPRVLIPQPAPWIQPATRYPPAGAKTMSYGPNMQATRAAQAAGGDDALLVTVDGRHVLEGPTFGVVWVAGGVVHAPDEALGIVASISRRTLLEEAADAGLEVRLGSWPVEELAAADEVIISSAVRDAIAVRRVGDWVLPEATPVRDLLSAALTRRRRG